MATKRYLQPAVSGQERELEKWDEDARRLINTNVCNICALLDRTSSIACSNECYVALAGGIRRRTRLVGTSCTMLPSDGELLVCATVSTLITLVDATCMPGQLFDVTNIGSCLVGTSELHCMYPCESITYQSACGGWRII